MEAVREQTAGNRTSCPSFDLLPLLEDSTDPGLSLITRVLHDQQQLTAVEQFARAHAADAVLPHARRYASLLPATPPAPGQQYAFEVDLDRCSGCQACVTACHALNGLDEQETWRDVGLLIGGTESNPIWQHVTTACHHCLEPGCLTACPVDAYEKHPVTGIVSHLDDQCFGCQYCTLACPYDVPKYHAGKGIVRKCDMCSRRLAVGEAPACVQACPQQAISITLVAVQDVMENAKAGRFLPAAPDPRLTLPTTRYKSARAFPENTLPADHDAVNPQHPHWPLIVMLVLTQLSIGAFVVGMVLDAVLDAPLLTAFVPLQATSALGFGLLALAASTLHLGRPRYAYRAIIGLRHSWLSREILAFGLFAAAAGCDALLLGTSASHELARAVGWSVATLGLLGVYCSVMVYVATGREFWSWGQTLAKFVLTSAILGIAATWLSILLLRVLGNSPMSDRLAQQAGGPLVRALMLASAAKLFLEGSLLRYLWIDRQSPLNRSARLLVGPLSNSTIARFASGLLGGLIMPGYLLNELTTDSARSILLVVTMSLLFLACLLGELLERYQFFAACVAPRMPGRFHS